MINNYYNKLGISYLTLFPNLILSKFDLAYNYICDLSNKGVRYVKLLFVIWFIYPIFSGILYQLGIGFNINIKTNIFYIPFDYKFKIGYIKKNKENNE